MTRQRASTIDPAEVARFERIAEDLVGPEGADEGLHRFNPVRLAYIRDAACRRFGARSAVGAARSRGSRSSMSAAAGACCRSPSPGSARRSPGSIRPPPTSRSPGCTRSGAGVAVDYRGETVEAVVAEGETFDMVLAMEVVEHVADVQAFVERLLRGREARRAPLHGDAEPDPARLRARHRRRRIRAGLAAQGHPPMGEVRHPGGADAGHRSGRFSPWTNGRRLQPAAGPWSLSRDDGVNYMVLATRVNFWPL